MGDRGPLQKDQRVRDRDTAKRDALKVDDEVRGWPLPEGVLGYLENADGSLREDEDGEPIPVPWHPQVVKWWEAFRRSPMAQRVVVDVQWESLLASMLAYQDVWTQGPKGRHSRLAEFRAVFTSFFITPGDLRRNGLEIEVPKADEEPKDESGKPTVAPVTSLEARKKRILAAVPDIAAEKAAVKKAAPKKKATPRKRSTAERAAIARKTTPAKKAVAKKTAAKRPSKPTS